MGFDFNVALLVMKSIIDTVRSQKEVAGRETYIDNVYTNESMMPAEHV